MIGQTLAHYRIEALIGKGGMGEVYRARDTRLERDVALKLLPSALADDPERLARFGREARVLAALSHANVAAIHGLEETGPHRYLVMELARGDDLAVVLRRGPLPPERALEIARQIALGLEEAHARGIVHRDLKPANVMVDPDGPVKILDFGLARALEGDAGDPHDPALSPTLTQGMTMPGLILGTAAYMSPEQARGAAADERADVWAFGVVLWEMLTGQRLFEGETVSDTLAAVLKTQPDWSLLPADTPPRLRDLLERCLAKKRRERLHAIADARLELDWILAGRDGRPAPAPPEARRLPALLIVAMMLVGGVVGVGLWNLVGGGHERREASAPSVVRKLSVVVPDDLVHLGDLMTADGRVLALRARPRRPVTAADAQQAIYLRPLDRDVFTLVPGSAGAAGYAFSPDSRWLGLVAPASPGSQRRRFWRVPVDLSTPPVALFDWQDSWGHVFRWLPDGDLLAGTRDLQIVRVPTDGRPAGEPIPIDGMAGIVDVMLHPETGSLLPDGRHVLVKAERYGEQRWQEDVHLLDIATGRMTLLIANAGTARFLAPGHLLFTRSGSLLAVGFDPDARTVSGTPIAITDGLLRRENYEHGWFDLAADGTLKTYPGGFLGAERQIFWLDERYRPLEPWSDDRGAFGLLLVSADGRRLAATRLEDDDFFGVWSSDVARPNLARRHRASGHDVFPMAWHADSRVLMLAILSADSIRIVEHDEAGSMRLRATGGGDLRRAQFFFVADDGRTVVGTRWTGGVPSIDAFELPPTGSPAIEIRPQDLVRLIDGGNDPALSPDSRWVTYEASLTGRPEIYARAWLGGGRLGEPIRVSREGGVMPRWYRPAGSDELQIHYLAGTTVLAAGFQPGSPPSVDAPEALSELDPRVSFIQYQPDGRMLTVLRGPREGPLTRIDLTTGWRQALEARLEP